MIFALSYNLMRKFDLLTINNPTLYPNHRLQVNRIGNIIANNREYPRETKINIFSSISSETLPFCTESFTPGFNNLICVVNYISKDIINGIPTYVNHSIIAGITYTPEELLSPAFRFFYLFFKGYHAINIYLIGKDKTFFELLTVHLPSGLNAVKTGNLDYSFLGEATSYFPATVWDVIYSNYSDISKFRLLNSDNSPILSEIMKIRKEEALANFMHSNNLKNKTGITDNPLNYYENQINFLTLAGSLHPSSLMPFLPDHK